MLKSLEPNASSRRDWLRGATRTAVLGGLSFAAAWLVTRKERGETNVCPRASVCSGCPIFHGCILPKRVRTGAKERLHD